VIGEASAIKTSPRQQHREGDHPSELRDPVDTRQKDKRQLADAGEDDESQMASTGGLFGSGEWTATTADDEMDSAAEAVESAFSQLSQRAGQSQAIKDFTPGLDLKSAWHLHDFTIPRRLRDRLERSDKLRQIVDDIGKDRTDDALTPRGVQLRPPRVMVELPGVSGPIKLHLPVQRSAAVDAVRAGTAAAA